MRRPFDFAMLRTAEIALCRQAKSFTLLDQVNLSSVSTYLTAPLYYRTAASGLSASGQNPLPAVGLFDDPGWSYRVMEPSQERSYYRRGVRLKVKLVPPGSYYPYDPAKISERLKRKYGINPGK